MRLPFRTKLLIGQLALVAVVVLVVTVELDRSLGEDLQRQLGVRLEQQAKGAAAWVDQNRHPERLVARLSDVVGVEVTIFDPNHRVTASSRQDPETVNLGPELAAAQNRGAGHAMRTSAEGMPMMHVAVPTEDGLLRLSAPLSNIDATILGVRRQLMFASLLGVVAAIALGMLGAALASRPLRKMTRAAEAIAEGDYDVELPAPTPDDFGSLSQALSNMARKLKADIARIQQLERVRRDFIANVSHELRTPVTAIQGYAETLLDDDTDQPSREEFLGAIHRQAERLAVLVAGVLQLSQLEARAPEEVVSEPVDLRAITVLAVRAAKAKHGPTMVPVEIAIDEGTMVQADPLGVEQVIDNLLDNAIKYGGERVVVEARTEPQQVALRVIDFGSGIGPEHRERVFERFYRVDPARSRRLGGSGLGLAIVKHLCEAMGGTVQVDSEPGQGAKFTVTLPRADAPA